MIVVIVVIVFFVLFISLFLLYLFVWPAATNRIASVGWQQEQPSDADLTSSSPSENAGSKSSGSASDQGAAASGAPKNSPTEGKRDPGYRTRYHEPFWGIWTFASKSASEAIARENRI